MRPMQFCSLFVIVLVLVLVIEFAANRIDHEHEHEHDYEGEGGCDSLGLHQPGPSLPFPPANAEASRRSAHLVRQQPDLISE